MTRDERGPATGPAPTAPHDHGDDLIERADPMPGEPRTEIGYANRLVRVYGDRLRYVQGWRRWLTWQGDRWAVDDAQAKRYAKAIARRVTSDAWAILDDKDRAAAVREAKRGESSAGITGTLNLASVDLAVSVTPADLDADPLLVNCRNGTLDLDSGELRDHDPADLLTKLTGAAYRPGTVSAVWQGFLTRVQPDEAMRGYLARLFGHALEGRVTEHLLPILWGEGANGKSTFVKAVSDALGDYAAPADPGLLTARTFDAHPTGIADLFGRRLAVLHETDGGRRLAEGTVKRLTGGDRVKARRMREDFWEFDPSHTFAMLTNHKPLITGTDEAMWRRLRLIPWPEVIPADERDEHLGDKLATEVDAVLAWLVAGYRAWRARGLDDPTDVTAATADYRAESDALARFLDECCVQTTAAQVRSGALFERWRRWCVGEGEDPGTQPAFARALQNRGLENKHTRDGSVWLGIGLAAEDHDEDHRQW